VGALTTNQVSALLSTQVSLLTSDQVGALSTAALAAMRTSQISALTTDQIVALQTNQIRALSTLTMTVLNSTQIIALETVDVASLRTTQLYVLTSAQIHAFTTNQVEALLSAQIPGLTTTALPGLNTDGTPIILDLNGDGVKTLGISSGVKFDLFADGNVINTGWVSSGDGLLVLDRNHDGQINDGAELFGSATTLVSGEKAPDGYAALKELDTDHDGFISNADAAYDDLRVWIDSNSDGVSHSGETQTLASLGIAKISVNATAGIATDNGNLLGLTSTYETTDGVTHAAADVWFASDRGGVHASAGTLDAAIAALNPPAALVVAAEGSLSHGAMQISPIDVNTPPDVLAAPIAPKDDLRSRATGLAQAIGAFGDTGIVGGEITTAQLNGAVGVPSTATPGSLAVLNMVDVMKQFDTNGNQVGSQAVTTASTAKSLKLPGVQEPGSNGVLTINGNT
jgi:hypothetical protein